MRPHCPRVMGPIDNSSGLDGVPPALPSSGNRLDCFSPGPKGACVASSGSYVPAYPHRRMADPGVLGPALNSPEVHAFSGGGSASPQVLAAFQRAQIRSDSPSAFKPVKSATGNAHSTLSAVRTVVLDVFRPVIVFQGCSIAGEEAAARELASDRGICAGTRSPAAASWQGCKEAKQDCRCRPHANWGAERLGQSAAAQGIPSSGHISLQTMDSSKSI